ncbi:hypothetical protein [Mariniblastus fucicola]|uniref:hypothetical protein n=1 Tax=Mariniblastus fucicola TaxID=980251 RepID=UPI0011DF8FBA|nr:hypothetical protein [Mariniblastus fucicola]
MRQFRITSLLIATAVACVTLAWLFSQTPLRNIWSDTDSYFKYNEDGTGIVATLYKNADDHVLAVSIQHQTTPKANPPGWSTSVATFNIQSTLHSTYSNAGRRPICKFRVDGENVPLDTKLLQVFYFTDVKPVQKIIIDEDDRDEFTADAADRELPSFVQNGCQTQTLNNNMLHQSVVGARVLKFRFTTTLGEH